MNSIGMQNKTIKKALDRKLKNWIDSIKDEEVRNVVFKNAIVTGGSIASMIMGDRVNDYDIYLRTKESCITVANYYAKLFVSLNANMPEIEVKEVKLKNINGEEEDRVVCWISSSGVLSDDSIKTEEDFDQDENDPGEVELESPKGKYVPVFISENAITLSNSIQIITRFYGEPKDIHRNYDFIHACCYYDWFKNELDTPVDALRSMQSKTLRYTGSLYPICSLFRLRKFISRGWKVSAGEILKISLQISRIEDLTDVRVLREQLIGCDALYFHKLISILQESGKSNFDSDYVTTIVDKVFQQ